jgi:uncharacterized repeat protein (TIGR03803 family)
MVEFHTPGQEWFCQEAFCTEQPIRVVRNKGVIFSLDTASSAFQTLHSFTGEPDGSSPPACLVLSQGTLYGTTLRGGVTSGNGTVFSMNADGTGFKVLHSFFPSTPQVTVVGAGTVVTNIDGAIPYSSLLLLGGTLYGTTSLGGTNGSGTIFALGTDGSGFKVLHNFAPRGPHTGPPSAQTVSTNEDGYYSVGRMVAVGSKLYGTTAAGGTNNGGTLFALNTNGSAFTLIHSFTFFNGMGQQTNWDGTWPTGLISSSNVVYGTCANGGLYNSGTVFSFDGSDYNVLHSFALVEGTHPIAGPFILGDRLYGTCSQGGTNGSGTVYSLRTDGDFSVIYSFSTSDATAHTNWDGYYPTSGLVPRGNLVYGTAQHGGTLGSGTIFALKIPTATITPDISAIQLNGDASITLRFTGKAQSPILVQVATNFTTPILWQTVATNQSGTTSWTQAFDKNTPTLYYRTVQE